MCVLSTCLHPRSRGVITQLININCLQITNTCCLTRRGCGLEFVAGGGGLRQTFFTARVFGLRRGRCLLRLLSFQCSRFSKAIVKKSRLMCKWLMSHDWFIPFVIIFFLLLFVMISIFSADENSSIPIITQRTLHVCLKNEQLGAVRSLGDVLTTRKLPRWLFHYHQKESDLELSQYSSFLWSSAWSSALFTLQVTCLLYVGQSSAVVDSLKPAQSPDSCFTALLISSSLFQSWFRFGPKIPLLPHRRP